MPSVPILLSIWLAAAPVTDTEAPRGPRIATTLVSAPLIGLVGGLLGFTAATYINRSGGGSAWPMRIAVTAGYCGGVALGAWVTGLRLNGQGSGWWALVGAVLGGALSLTVMGVMNSPEGNAAGATLAVLLPVFSSSAFYELSDYF